MTKIETSKQFAKVLNNELACSPTFNDCIDGNKVQDGDKIIVSTPQDRFFIITIKDVTRLIKKSEGAGVVVV